MSILYSQSWGELTFENFLIVLDRKQLIVMVLLTDILKSQLDAKSTGKLQ